ncbi:MAG: signal peptide peptidase SppA [Bacillota bacterium]
MNFSIKKMTVSIILSVFIILLLVGVVGFLIISIFSGGSQVAEENIAVINVSGAITAGSSQQGFVGQSSASSTDIIKQIKQAKENDKVQALLLRINSPGGSSAASDEIYRELKKFKESEKPLVVSMADIAASGGYYISAIADQIFANPSTITGSIGVVMQFKNLQELYNKLGVDTITFKSGSYKDTGNPNRKLTNKEKEMLEEMVDSVYQEFLTAVVEGRDMSKNKVEQLADGRIYTGRQAKKLGLVDQLGTFYDAVTSAAKLANIDQDANLIYYNRPSPLEKMLGSVNKLVRLLATNLGLEVENSPALHYRLLEEQKMDNLQLEY